MGYLAILIVLVFAAPLVMAFVHDYRFNQTVFMEFLEREKKKSLLFALGVAGYFFINYLAES